MNLIKIDHQGRNFWLKSQNLPGKFQKHWPPLSKFLCTTTACKQSCTSLLKNVRKNNAFLCTLFQRQQIEMSFSACYSKIRSACSCSKIQQREMSFRTRNCLRIHDKNMRYRQVATYAKIKATFCFGWRNRHAVKRRTCLVDVKRCSVLRLTACRWRHPKQLLLLFSHI